MKTEIFEMDLENGGMKKIDTSVKFETGTIVLFKGYGKDGKQYAALDEFSGTQQKFVSLDEDEPGFTFDYPGSIQGRKWNERKGIGLYMPIGDMQKMAGSDQLLDAINRAKESERNQREKREHEREERERQEKIGKQMFDKMKPENAEAVIIAQLREDESDMMTDYFGSSRQKNVLLAWSTHERNLFPEMRKASAKFEHTEHLAEKNKDFEHREDYSGGHGYYLKDGWFDNTGWHVEKKSLRWGQDEIYRALAQGHHVLKEEETKAAEKSESGDVRIEEYSDKALVVRGDTYAMKDQLKDLGGKFNYRLKGGPGWIFSKRRREELETAIL